MNITSRLTIAIMSFMILTGCGSENDKSNSDNKSGIVTIEVEGQESVKIDSDNCVIDIVLDESVDITDVKVKDVIFSKNASVDEPIGPSLDLSKPVYLVVNHSSGKKQEWTINAVQHIDRYIRCNGLLEAVFTPKETSALVSVPDTQPLDSIVITDMKLGPVGSKIVSTTGYNLNSRREKTNNVSFPMNLDCSLTRTFEVEHNGERTEWTVTFIQKMTSNVIQYVNPWVYRAEVKAEFNGKGNPYFEYKKRVDNDWKRFSKVSIDGKSITADITNLSAGTDYFVRLVNGGLSGDEKMFTTFSPKQVDGMGFNSWHKGGDNGKMWRPSEIDDNSPIWDSSNLGVYEVVDDAALPESKHKVEGKFSAKLISKSSVVNFIAGAIFTGTYLKCEEWISEVSLGVSFDSKPHSLKGWYDYRPGIINRDDKRKNQGLMGKKDSMLIEVALVAEGEGSDKGPFIVNSEDPGKLNLKNNPRVIAYGEFIGSNETDKFTEFEIPLQYKPDDRRMPAYVIIIASSSAKGEYQTGAVGSELYVDGFKFIYK